MDCITRGNVQTSLLKHTCARVDAIPSRHALFGNRDVPRNTLVEPSAKITDTIVARTAKRPFFAFERVPTARVEQLVAHDTLGVAVLAASASRAKRQKQAVTQSHHEVSVWQRSRPLTLASHRWLQEASSPRPTRGAEINTIILPQTSKKLFASAGMQAARPNSLLLRLALHKVPHPVRTVNGIATISPEPSLCSP